MRDRGEECLVTLRRGFLIPISPPQSDSLPILAAQKDALRPALTLIPPLLCHRRRRPDSSWSKQLSLSHCQREQEVDGRTADED